MSDLTWATVTGTSPLRIKLDGDSAALVLTPDSLVYPGVLAVADRVRVELYDRRVVIIGRSAGDVRASSAEAIAGTDASKLITPATLAAAVAARAGRSRIRNGDFRINQRGYVSAASLPPQQYGPDGWCASGLVNLYTNPSAEVTTAPWGGSTATLTRDTGYAASGGGSASFKLVAAGADSFMYMGNDTAGGLNGFIPGETYTVIGVIRLTAAMTGAVQAGRERGITLHTNNGSGYVVTTSASAPNAAGETRIVFTFTIPRGSTQAFLRFYAGQASGTVWWDNLMLLRGDWSGNPPTYFDGSTAGASWTGTTHASASYNVASAPTLTLPSAPQGGLATLSSGGRVFQILERADVAAGDWTLAWDGTATARIYNAGTAIGSRPAFAAGPVTATLDGLDDVIVEFQASGATKTFGNVRLTPGTVAQAFVVRPIGEERALCFRFAWHPTAAQAGGDPIAFGFQQTTVDCYCRANPPVPLRILPVLTYNNVVWSDGTNFSTGVTAIYVSGNTQSTEVTNISMNVKMPASGAGLRPGILSMTSTASWMDFDAEMRKYAA